uniref:RRM domain-containing protein n=2 Tax=Timema TaxID=61471 RepID=A0A7R8VFP0_TIMDO|nr:unnamed protein product [Timema douglasi]
MSRYREWDLSCKLYVGNLGSSASKHEIESAFTKYGPLRNVWVARNPPGFAFVEFEDPRDAEDAVRGLDGTRLCGTRVRVEMSSGRSRRGGGGGGGGGGRRNSGPTSHPRHLLLLRVMSRGHLTTTNQPQQNKSALLYAAPRHLRVLRIIFSPISFTAQTLPHQVSLQKPFTSALTLRFQGQTQLSFNTTSALANYATEAGTSPVMSFLSTYARQLGFSSIIVGTIFTVLPVCGMLAKPIFGAVADHFRLQKTLFVAFQVLTALAFFMVQFVPEIATESQVSLDCDGLTIFKICGQDSLDQCSDDTLSAQIGLKTIVKCEFNCDLRNSSLAEEVCKTWNITKYCRNNEEFFPSTSSVQQVWDSSDFTLHKMGDEFSETLTFTADVPMEHVLWRRLKTNHDVEPASLLASCSPKCWSLFSTAKCDVKCDNEAVNEVITRTTTDDSDVSSLYQFWTFFLLLILSWVGMAVVVSVGDAICFGMLGDKPSQYGRQRLWGAVGWGIFSVLSGALVDKFSQGQVKKNYTSIFYLMLVMISLDFGVSLKLKHSQTTLSTSIMHDICKLLKNVQVVVFMLWCVAVGLSTGLLWQFLFWHLEDLASANEGCEMRAWIKTLQGLVSGVQCFGGELPFLFISGAVLKKIGHAHAMSLVLGAFGIRFLLYSFLYNPWWCLPIELLQGVTFGLFYATMASYASIVAPPGTEATVQGLVGAIFEGVGVSLGSLIGGTLYDQQGGSFTFRMFGIGSLVLCLLHFIIQRLLGKSLNYAIKAKDFDMSARYAAPTDAIHMLEDQQELVTT